MNIGQIYKNRFCRHELQKKEYLWKILCQNFLQKFVKKDAIILDLAAGFCEFINNIDAEKKYANDINPEAEKYAGKNVFVINNDASKLELKDNSIDIVFVSNFFEHLKSKEELLYVLKEVKRVLKKRGRIIILQPNIKYAYKEYWDFIDHSLALTDISMKEALELSGFQIILNIPKFLPFSTKSRFSNFMFLLKIYLKIPILWKIFGRQMFMIGEKRE